MLRVVIDGVDRTEAVKAGSVHITLGTTKEATTARLSIDRYGSKFTPAGEQEVAIWWDTDAGNTKIFGGYMTRVTRSTEQGHVVTYQCELKNYVHLLDRKLVNVGYEAQTAAEIIDDIVTNYGGAGITTTAVDPDAALAITSISFNNVAPSEAIQKLADVLGCEWFIDQDKDVHFFSKLTEAAPFNLTDLGGKYVFESLVIAEDFSQIRNSILVEGGKELSTVEETDTFEGDGVQHTFTLSREYSDLTVTVNAVGQTVGIQNIDSFDDFDCLYDFNLHTLYFDPASPPGAGLEIEITAPYYFPIAVRYRELTSLGAYGERQHFIQDPTIKSRADAGNRALAEISAYARRLREGSFTTYEQGLSPGQKITISSDVDAFSADFVIQRMNGTVISPERMEWRVEVVSVKTYELIDLLAEIIRGRRVESPSDQVITTAERVNRAILVSRTSSIRTAVDVSRPLLVARDTLTYIDDPPIWVAGPYIPSSLADRKRVLFADRGCLVS
jgi:hypothetical protein